MVIAMIENYFHNCLYFTASTLSRAITRIAEEEFRTTGLSPTYAFLILIVIDRPGISQKELGKILHITQSTITRFIDKLESEKFVTRQSSGKSSLIHPTDRGRAARPDIEKAWKRLYDRYTKALGQKDSEKLTTLTDRAGLLLEK